MEGQKRTLDYVRRKPQDLRKREKGSEKVLQGAVAKLKQKKTLEKGTAATYITIRPRKEDTPTTRSGREKKTRGLTTASNYTHSVKKDQKGTNEEPIKKKQKKASVLQTLRGQPVLGEKKGW